MVSSGTKLVAFTWLDRLRLSRGFTTIENEIASDKPLTLDDFLRRNQQTEITGEPASSSPSDSPPSAPIPSDPELAESPLEPGRCDCCGVMTDVISELFSYRSAYARAREISRKKCPRKQPNPRHCSLVYDPPESQFLPGVGQSLARYSYDKKPAPAIKERKRIVAEAEGVGEEEEEEEGEKDLIGFSRSEVTVIDTSFKIWKSEKLVFRRRNVWKVKDNKGKSQAVSLKMKKTKTQKKITKKQKNKRKCDGDDGEITRKGKKMKISRSVPDNKQRDQNEEVDDDPESSNVNQSLLSRLPSKLRKEGGFRIQTSKRNLEPEARDHQSMEPRVHDDDDDDDVV